MCLFEDIEVIPFVKIPDWSTPHDDSLCKNGGFVNSQSGSIEPSLHVEDWLKFRDTVLPNVSLGRHGASLVPSS